jgi:predicted RNase H-like HicB family nuclease
MHNEFTAIIEKDEDWFIACCAELPGANGQGKTKEQCHKSLSEAIPKYILTGETDEKP